MVISKFHQSNIVIAYFEYAHNVAMLPGDNFGDPSSLASHDLLRPLSRNYQKRPMLKKNKMKRKNLNSMDKRSDMDNSSNFYMLNRINILQEWFFEFCIQSEAI